MPEIEALWRIDDNAKTLLFDLQQKENNNHKKSISIVNRPLLSFF